MDKKLNLILLLDDNPATNFIHKKFIVRANCTKEILDFQNGIKTLEYLTSEENALPELLFVDINMPIMDAWEFLEEFKKIDRKGIRDIIVILLSTSLSPSDQEKAKIIEAIHEIRIKPLTEPAIQEVLEQYFPIVL